MKHTTSTYLLAITLRAILLLGVLSLASCARMGSPDGGWYDETPPHVVSTSPADKGTNVRSNKIQILFDELIKLENPTEKVVFSPPQLEQPDIKTHGKSIVITLNDTLKDNTTYTIDFSDAITDNNEGNPMGNYTYSFSTGPQIDTLEVSGTVLSAADLEPVKGMLVGLTTTDSVGGTMLRVSRTDSRGKFIIRGIAPGDYCCYALNDQDDNYRFSQRSEDIAFSHDIITPYSKPDIRQDTLWLDSLHIKDIEQVGYTHFYPDDITLMAFTHPVTDRFYLKSERTVADHMTMFFSGPGTMVPEVRIVDEYSAFNGRGGDDLFVIEASEKLDTITYWLRDTALINTDTLNIECRYETTDTLGNMIIATDTIPVLSKVSYAKRMKDLAQEVEKWKKSVEKRRKRGEEVLDSIMPTVPLKPKFEIPQTFAPNSIIRIEIPTPLASLDTAAIHLYCHKDSSWFRAPFQLRRATFPSATDRHIEIVSDWLPGTEYSLEADTLAFIDIYGQASAPSKNGFKVRTLDTFASLFVNVSSTKTDISSDSVVVQLLDNSDKVLMSSLAVDGTAEFYYLSPGTFYMRAYVDSNGNGRWDEGDFYNDVQPEQVYYYNEPFECKANWDLTKNWNLTQLPLSRQKPGKLTKQKADKAKTIRQRNAQRAREKGIEVPDIPRK